MIREKRHIFFLVFFAIHSFLFAQVSLVTADTTFEGKARVWYFSNVIVVYPDISENQLRQKAETCLSGGYLFRNCMLTRRAHSTAIIYDMGYYYHEDETGIRQKNMPSYFLYSESWQKKQRKLEFLDGAFKGVVEALYYGFDY